MNYKDGPEYYDPIYALYHRKTLPDDISVRDECKTPKIKKISKNVKNSSALDLDEDIIDLLEKEICTICKQKPNPYDTVLYFNPHNGQISWLCDTCSRPQMNLYKWDRWHRLPAFKRKNEASLSEDVALYFILANEGININKLKDILGWSYGKTRGACKRLESNGLIRIEHINEKGYRECRIYTIE